MIPGTVKTAILQYRRWLIAGLHFALITLAYTLAFLIRFEFTLPSEYRPIFLGTLPLIIIAKEVVFYRWGLFRGLWQYSGLDDLLQIIKASVASTIIFILAIVFVHGLAGFPRSVFLIDLLIFTSLACGIRLSTRIIKERPRKIVYSGKPVRRLIVGAGETGVMVLRQFEKTPGLGTVVGFIDDDKRKHLATVDGIKILGGRQKIAEAVRSHKVDEIIVAMPSAKGEEIRAVLACCEIPGVALKIVPSLDKIIDGSLEAKPRQVKLDDLLGRHPVEIDRKDVEVYLKGKRVLVTGAGGSIGSELCRQIIRYTPEEILLLDHNENDVYFLGLEFNAKFPQTRCRTIIGSVQDVGLLRKVFSEFRPAVAFHAAAHKHVPLMEENPIAAIKNNIIGTRNLVYAAAHYHTERFVLISTDKAVNPTSVMGATKRIAEMILQSKATEGRTKFMAVRFGNVIGSAGSVVPLFKRQIEEGGPVTVTHPEVKRFFMSIPEAASLVLQAGALGKGGEIFILDMGEQIKICDLARNLIGLSGLVPDKDITIEFTGLRPGEKLYEEILHDKEHDAVTRHEKIFISTPETFDPAKLRARVRQMEACAKSADSKKAVALITELVPIHKNPSEKHFTRESANP